MNDQAAIEMVGHANSILTLDSVPKNLNETSVEDIEKMSDIKSLMTCIKKLPREQSINKSQDNIISNKTDQVSRGSTTSIQSRANLQKSGDKGGQSSLKYHAMGMESKKFNYGKEKPSTEVHFMACTESMGQDGDKSDLDVAVFDHIKLEPSPQVALPTSKEHLKKNPDTYLLKKETREGLQKALKKTDLRVRNSDAIVGTTSSLEDMPNRISIPNLIVDPDVPVSLVKNPSRTIMIKELTHGISLRHLKEAFSFCESGISRLFLGSSSSVAYVEFETEDAKEKAIAKHSIDVLGERLLIFRIDAPRTTVVRMSIKNLQNPLKSVQSILTSYGQVKHIQLRNKDTLDAYFNLAEWPNMLNILNSLNGMKVHGCQLLVQPAPVYPPDILQILWSQPDGRRHVKAVMHNLCQKLEVNPINTTGLTHLLAKHYGEGF
ncbi:hypothetical protein L1049_017765 [Liquidambar formosana]|uniref:RRM domain-containing protein n=1 Tax=Liquidambar formosana TaxID=63359 RepID=A0AAP0S408_LIQFO